MAHIRTTRWFRNSRGRDTLIDSLEYTKAAEPRDMDASQMRSRSLFVQTIATLATLTVTAAWPDLAFASPDSGEILDLTAHGVGLAGIVVFVVAYVSVMAEEYTHLRKSKPVILAAGIIWGMIAVVYAIQGDGEPVSTAIRHDFLGYAELMMILLVGMTYINAMDERRVFKMLCSWLVRKGFGYRPLFWITGFLAFFISPVADNLTTALLMSAVVLAVGSDNVRFVGLASINTVVAANAGGTFSPFGDITTLMVWQKGMVDFREFFLLFIPALVNFLLPAAVMHFAIPNLSPAVSVEAAQKMKRGAKRILVLFLLTLVTAVSFQNFLHLAPVFGMMTGLAYLQFFGYYLKTTGPKRPSVMLAAQHGDVVGFDVFNKVARAEWDTLLFFYGIVLCVGGLNFIGYLSLTCDVMYTQWGATTANVTVGLISAIMDNIPVMFAVLSMDPDMPLGQWLLVTLTAGVGGSLLSIGSAAGIAVMGQARGQYTFFSHLKWTPVIAVGYAASILVHMWLNANSFHI
jgi:Na+/H+ antiporter NhaD/arsenite permease-like protein